MSKFKAGDIVTVVDWGRQYSTYADWFLSRKSEFPAEWLVKYAYDNCMFERPLTHKCYYTVLYVAGNMYLIGECRGYTGRLGSVYLISEGGIALAPKRMTKADIEKELGYTIEIIEEDEDE